MTERKIEEIIEGLSPKQRDGLTVGGEDVGTMPTPPTTSQLIGHMKDKPMQGRVPVATFVAENDPSEYWNLGDERVVGGADVTYTKEVIDAMKAGMICLRCGEAQEHSFPLGCELCGYSMKELQIRDMALEIKGEKHLGPSEPISAHIDRLDEEALKLKFAKKIQGGKSPMKGLSHRAT